MNEDFAWFKENYAEFQSKYGNSFVVIKNKNVIGVYNSYADGVRNTLKTEPIGTFIVQEINKDYEAYNCYISSINFS